MLPDSIAALLQDGNAQNRHAANAGDGPKHIGWLTFIEILGDGLGTLVETHSGGGVYRVAENQFCVGLPATSILGRHQATAGLPPPDKGGAYYSASGDQALLRMPVRCTYLAYDKERTTANRLQAVARWRGRQASLDSRSASYMGDGDPSTTVGAHIKNKLDVDRSGVVLAMIDPFKVSDLERACRLVAPVGDLRTIAFGVAGLHRGTADSKAGWDRAVDRFAGRHRVAWTWTGLPTPGADPQHLFFLLLVTPEPAEAKALQERLSEEHALLTDCRAGAYGYTSEGPRSVP